MTQSDGSPWEKMTSPRAYVMTCFPSPADSRKAWTSNGRGFFGDIAVDTAGRISHLQVAAAPVLRDQNRAATTSFQRLCRASVTARRFRLTSSRLWHSGPGAVERVEPVRRAHV